MEKTKKMMVGITATAFTLTLVGCGTSTTTSSKPPVPEDDDCDDWEWSEEEGVWRCDDSHSSRYRSYYHGGRYYSNLKDLQSSSDYQNYINSQNNGKTSSGFGSGTKNYGG